MTGRTGWKSDACPCRVLLEKNGSNQLVLSNWIVKCHIHKDELDANLLNAVLVQNHLFDAEPDEVIRIELKEAEYIRVKGLGALTVNDDPEVQRFV